MEKQNATLSIPKALLNQAKLVAARRPIPFQIGRSLKHGIHFGVQKIDAEQQTLKQ